MLLCLPMHAANEVPVGTTFKITTGTYTISYEVTASGGTTETNLVKVTGISGSGEVTIPSTVPYNEYKLTVNEMGTVGWAVIKNITKLVLPETLTKMDANCIADLGVTELTIPKNVVSISDQAFLYLIHPKFTVDTENKVYANDANGNLVSKSGKTIYALNSYQDFTDGVGKIPEGTDSVSRCVVNTSKVTTLWFPKSVIWVKNDYHSWYDGWQKANSNKQ